MARIPTVTSQISARSGATTAGVPSRQASPDAFGAGMGRALQSLGGGLDTAARGLDAFQQNKQKEDAANAVAQSDFTRRELELRNEVGADASGYQDRTLEEYDAFVDEQAESIEDDATRELFKQRMAGQRNAVSSRAAQYEMGTAAQSSKDQADASLVSLDNKIRLMPGGYDSYIEQGFDVIDARPNLTATVREQMKTQWRANSALSRFEGILEAANTVEEVREVQAELSDTETRDWTKELSAAGLERISTLADAAGRSIQTKTDADARGAIDYLEGRASDVTAIIPREELQAAQQLVDASQNPVTAARMARIVRDQEIVAQTRKLPPAQQRDLMDTKYSNPSLPPRLNTAITNAARTFGVSPAYLAATAKREYGMFLTGDPDSIDYGKGNAEGASSALGPMQFIKSTWLGVVKNPDFQAAAGISTEGKTDAELLAMRGDVDIALMGGAFFTANNAKLAKQALRREPTDVDLYIMHFMGEGGGPRLFNMMRANPEVEAADMFPEQAKANRSVYYNKDGSARTVRELYAELGRKHGTGDGSETYVEYGDRQTREKIISDSEARIANDVMSYSFDTGTSIRNDIFEPGGMAARGEQARSVADYYSIATSDMTPFTKEEASQISSQFKDGSADDVLGILTTIQQMGGDMARAGMSQIGSDGDTYAYAGSLQLETGQGAVAADIVKGQKRIEENPDVTKSMGATPTELSDAFLSATGGAIFEAAPKQRQAISDAATAHYVETQVAKGRAGHFDPDAYMLSVQSVLGGREGVPALETVNGSKTVMPPGVTGPALEQAFENMTVADWTTMSEEGTPPRYVTGEIADPEDLADEAQLRAIGGGKYRVVTSDGAYLVTGRPAANGQLEPYIFVPTADVIGQINGRDAARAAAITEGDATSLEQEVNTAQEDGELSHLEYRALVKKYGAAAVEAYSQGTEDGN